MTKELHVVGISGGKDSTALGLRMIETSTHPLTFLITPTGDELPPMITHWAYLRQLVINAGHQWIELRHPVGGLVEMSTAQKMLPNAIGRIIIIEHKCTSKRSRRNAGSRSPSVIHLEIIGRQI